VERRFEEGYDEDGDGELGVVSSLQLLKGNWELKTEN
jgi:hypothetical protein